jgi:CheY-like chemotaxis protein
MNHWPTILLVEDDPNDVFFFQKALRDRSIPAHVQRMSDGDTAIEYLKEQGHLLNRGTPALPGLGGDGSMHAQRGSHGVVVLDS